MICPHTNKDTFTHDSRCIHKDGHPECNCKGAPAGKLIPMLGGCCGMECYLPNGNGRACPPVPGSKPCTVFMPDGTAFIAMETKLTFK